MSVDPASLQIGQCYLTHTGLVRRVIAFHRGQVQYETRSNKRAGGWAWRPGIVDPKVFASLLDRPVPCDWTPETDRS
jgi:hypothetical protein